MLRVFKLLIGLICFLLLEKGERSYAGISTSDWLDYFSRYKVGFLISEEDTLANKVKMGKKKVLKILRIISRELGYTNLVQLKFSLRKERIIEILYNGFVVNIDSGQKVHLEKEDYFEVICKNCQGINPGNFLIPRSYFEKGLFGLSVDEIWDMYYRGGPRIL